MSDSHDELIQELIGDADGALSCPLCGQPHEADGVRVLRHLGERYTLSVQCFCCGTGSLMTVRAPLGDEPADEWSAHLQPIGVDEVLGWHRFLAEYRGDIQSLLSN
jgi:hypothetical protein